MAGKIKWTEEKIKEFEAHGRGKGLGVNYQPWLNRLTFSSRGRCRTSGLSPKTGRVHELFSDVEYNFFLCLERDRSVTDIREQYPLDRNFTREVARELQIRHPIYPGTSTPVVMTVDFLVTKYVNNKEQFEAFNTKTTQEMEDTRSMEKLEIQRRTLQLMGIPHHLVLDSMISRDLIKKLEWMRRPAIDDNESVPFPDYWEQLEHTFCSSFFGSPSTLTLSQFCRQLDKAKGLPMGTGLTIARRMMFSRALEPDLEVSSLPDAPLATFRFDRAVTEKRALGGAW